MSDPLFVEEPKPLTEEQHIVVPPEMLDAAVNAVDEEGRIFLSKYPHWPGMNRCLQAALWCFIDQEPEDSILGKMLRRIFLPAEPSKEVTPVAQTVDLLWKAHKGDAEGEERAEKHNEAVFEAYKRGLNVLAKGGQR